MEVTSRSPEALNRLKASKSSTLIRCNPDTKKYKKTDGSPFDTHTIQNIEEGHKMLSEGIVVGGRNPLQHEEHKQLSTSGLFSEKDCLDFLSLLSHLFKRLDDAETP